MFLYSLIKLLFYIYILSKTNCMPIEENKINNSHLKYEHIRNLCLNRSAVCKSNDTVICATRLYNGAVEYEDYDNSCFLYINNMCENYDKEFSIVSDGSCSDYIKFRRSDVKDNNTTTSKNSITTVIKTSSKNVTVKTTIRSETSTSLYDIDTAFDFHICPLSCPNVYNPVCIGVNRGHGLYYKFFTFVNHCEGDRYYCKHWREFSPPPDEEEMVKSSPLSWSYCAANRYIQFARFTEMTSSMGYYGWLAGDYKPTHIMEPHERMPGYG